MTSLSFSSGESTNPWDARALEVLREIGFCGRLSSLVRPFNERREARYFSGPRLSGSRICSLSGIRDSDSKITQHDGEVHISVATPEAYEFSATLTTKSALGIIYTHIVDKKRELDPEAPTNTQYMLPSHIKELAEILGCNEKFFPLQLKDEGQAAFVLRWVHGVLTDFRKEFFSDSGCSL